MEQYQYELSQISPLFSSPVQIDRIEILAEPMLRSSSFIEVQPSAISPSIIQPTLREPTIDDGIDIFDFSSPSENVPFIKYNSADKKLTKLYKGQSIDTIPDYSVIIPSEIRSNKPNTFYMTVWSGHGDIRKATKKSYKYGKYNLETNRLTIRSPVTDISDEQIILDRLRQAFPLDISNVSEISVGGEFYIYDLEIQDYILVDMIMNNDLMRSYLFIDEVSNPYAEKAQLSFRYS